MLIRGMVPYMGEGVLKARGCMLFILSPLSQVTLARLVFRSSASWAGLKGRGAAEWE